MDEYWKDIYHHEECENLPEDSSATYYDICSAQWSGVTELPRLTSTGDMMEDGGIATFVYFNLVVIPNYF